MAKRITAIQALTPRIELQGRFVTETMCELISRRTSLNRGEIENVLRELHENMVDALSAGRPVKLDGIGTFTPVIRLNGELSINVRVDREPIKDLNKPGRFTGGIRNRPNIGRSADELIQGWNANHPDDPVVD
jgi:nucleoid DNA-binding protein